MKGKHDIHLLKKSCAAYNKFINKDKLHALAVLHQPCFKNLNETLRFKKRKGKHDIHLLKKSCAA
jgi:hypothetical protein